MRVIRINAMKELSPGYVWIKPNGNLYYIISVGKKKVKYVNLSKRKGGVNSVKIKDWYKDLSLPMRFYPTSDNQS